MALSPQKLLPDNPICPTAGTLVSSSKKRRLFHQMGDVELLTSADVVSRSHQALKEFQADILAES